MKRVYELTGEERDKRNKLLQDVESKMRHIKYEMEENMERIIDNCHNCQHHYVHRIGTALGGESECESKDKRAIMRQSIERLIDPMDPITFTIGCIAHKRI